MPQSAVELVLVQTVKGWLLPETRIGVLALLVVGKPKKVRNVATSLLPFAPTSEVDCPTSMSLVPAMAIVCPVPSIGALLFHSGRML